MVKILDNDISFKAHTTAGTSTAFTLTYPRFILSDESTILVEFHTNCGDNATLNVNGGGALNLKTGSGANVKANDLKTTGRYELTYNAGTTSWIVNEKVDSEIGKVSDTAYATSWNGVTDIAPSKNAVYDHFETIAPWGVIPTPWAIIAGSTYNIWSVAWQVVPHWGVTTLWERTIQRNGTYSLNIGSWPNMTVYVYKNNILLGSAATTSKTFNSACVIWDVIKFTATWWDSWSGSTDSANISFTFDYSSYTT